MTEDKIALDFELTSNSPDAPMKRWGMVSAAPSEFLIVYRRGELDPSLCGQGGRFFKWPSDTCVAIPTTLKEICFQANQITADNVDVRLRGMVLYRIADPVRIHRLINFTRRQQAEAKLARVIADMCRSTAKWLVANMGLEECNRRRKEEIAAILKQEVEGVVSESWGVEIVTIDVQDIYIQDDALFTSMQAAYKAEQSRRAALAELESRQDLERRRLESERALEENRQALALEKTQREADLKMARLQIDKRQDEAEFERNQKRAERAEALAQQQARQREAAEAARELARLKAEAAALCTDEEIRALRERLAAEDGAGRASLERLFLTESLPALAATVGKSLEHSRMVVYQGEGGGPVPMALSAVLDVLQQRLSGVE
jgi:flotillin